MSISNFFNVFLYQPLFNVLILIYVYFPWHDFGVAVILLTLLIRVVVAPASIKAVRSQKALSALQPKIKEIQRRYKDDKEKQSKAMFELYQKEKVNPLSGCLPLLLQLPILIALYRVFLKGFTKETLKTYLYKIVPYPPVINLTFLGVINLTQPNFPLALLAGLAQFFQSKISMGEKTSSQKDATQAIQKQMAYFLPLFTVFIVWKLGAMIGLYWLTSTLFSIGEHYLIKVKNKS
jgi:YidC/Oxa1 family membrane protein insertase